MRTTGLIVSILTVFGTTVLLTTVLGLLVKFRSLWVQAGMFVLGLAFTAGGVYWTATSVNLYLQPLFMLMATVGFVIMAMATLAIDPEAR